MAWRDFLNTLHPVYKEREQEWRLNKQRMKGGFEILRELTPFDWESISATGQGAAHSHNAMLTATVPGAHYKMRQGQALYLNFAEQFAAVTIGHIFRKAPVAEQGLSFGSLGPVKQLPGDRPTRASMIYYNVDGVGNDGSQWDNYWAGVMAQAMTFGHVWLMVEAPAIAPRTQQDELQGRRPYLVTYTPLQVINWDYTIDGYLAWAVIKFRRRNPHIESVTGGLTGNEYEDGFRLLVRRGFGGLGAAYAGGGWWEYTGDGDTIAGRSGTWDTTNGAIPMWMHFYQRDRDAISRSGTTEMGNASVAYMNLDSAASFDAWDAGVSMQFMLGVDPDAFKIAMDKVREGSRFVPVPPYMGSGTDKGNNPVVHDASTGAVASEVFDKRLTSIRSVVRELSGLELSGASMATGEAKRMGFNDIKSPRLALMASELEQSQNTAIWFFELRFGGQNPTGEVIWPRDFALQPMMDQLRSLFELEKLTGYRSPLVGQRGLTQAALDTGIIVNDEDRLQVEQEYLKAATEMIDREAKLAEVAMEAAAMKRATLGQAPGSSRGDIAGN